MLLFLVILILTWTNDVVTALESGSRRSDDVSFQSLMTLVQQQAATLQTQAASLQAMQNRISILEHSHNSDISRLGQSFSSNFSRLEHSFSSTISQLQHTVSDNSAVLKSVDTRLSTQVFFTAHMMAVPVDAGRDSPLKFDAAVTNIGGAYNPATGVFTAPVSGVYVFYAQLMKHADAPSIQWMIEKSGTTLCKNTNVTPNNAYDKSSCLATARLRKGDQVFVRRVADVPTAPGRTLEGTWWCSFTGYLTSMDE